MGIFNNGVTVQWGVYLFKETIPAQTNKDFDNIQYPISFSTHCSCVIALPSFCTVATGINGITNTKFCISLRGLYPSAASQPSGAFWMATGF